MARWCLAKNSTSHITNTDFQVNEPDNVVPLVLLLMGVFPTEKLSEDKFRLKENFQKSSDWGICLSSGGWRPPTRTEMQPDLIGLNSDKT